jgi:hypothetical protein
VAGVAIILIGFSIYQNTRPIGPIELIEKEEWPLANGTALGAKDAKVVVEEFSDFQ